MIRLIVAAEDDETEVFGKDAGDLQENIVVKNGSIAGTLKYVTGYTGYSGDPALQSGNFLALRFEAPEHAKTTIELVGGNKGAVELDADMNAVIRIMDNETQKLRVVCISEESTRTVEYSLSELVCESATFAQADSDSDDVLSEEELTALPVASIRALASEKGYTLTGRTKAELITSFLAAQEAAAGGGSS